MTVTAPTRRPSVAARRAGYVIAAALTAVFAYLVNVRPGWESLSFLTEETPQVLGLVNLSLAVGFVANMIYVFADPPRLKALGDLVTTSVGLVVLVRVWQVFPFDFEAYSFNVALLLRVLLIIAMVGSVIGIAVQLATLARSLVHPTGRG